MYEMSEWFHDLKNLFEKLDGLKSDQAYRRVVDNIEEFVEMFHEGASPKQAYNDYWDV